MTETLGIAGAGTIATGLAALATTATDVILWARSSESAERARGALARSCEKLAEQGADLTRATVVTDLTELGRSTYLVEAIAEDRASKATLLAALGDLVTESGDDTIVATTTSSLCVADLAEASGVPERFAGLHVFNPVPRMQLVEVVFPPRASGTTRARTSALCEALGKTAIEVPDTPGFIVNRLLFPYLFDAVAFMAANALEAEQVDTCMTLGAGLPMGPLALLDFVGLDVAKAIGESIGLAVPAGIRDRIAAGALGRKVGRGFYIYP
ncbi:MAG TPA: 3-hydroxyacyl-CoA dehydrogenase family protein [Solirubrobacteraceae bacterium]|nr:3-hydroxyacyl-CoA dehydrogenase family protein [Solirubrobacteraceae bacterium]